MATIDWLPLEVLWTCFVFLPFRDRLTATLVSRSWRASALAAPEVWSDINISSRMKSPHQTLALSLSRAGMRPVNLSVDDHLPEDWEGPFMAVLNLHMHHVRSIDWGHSWRPSLMFDHSFPSLESFRQVGLKYSLTPNLFGGKVGNLRHLHLETVSLPSICPALATVTDLRIESAEHGLSHLFLLFPRLRSLALLGIKEGHALILHGLRPPPTLSELELSTRNIHADLLELYDLWPNENLTDVRLIMDLPFPAAHLRLTSFLSDARTLGVEISAGDSTRISALDSRARRRALILKTWFGHWDGIIEGFKAAQECLTHLRSFTVSATVLSALCRTGSFALPALSDITLVLDQEQEIWTKNSASLASWWPWVELDQISAFVRSLGVEALTLEMRCLDTKQPPTLEDGRKLLCEYVPLLVQCEVQPAPRLRVRGLPREVAEELSSELPAVLLDWDTGTIVLPGYWL